MKKQISRLAAVSFLVTDLNDAGRPVQEELITVPLQLLWPFTVDLSLLAEQVEAKLQQDAPPVLPTLGE